MTRALARRWTVLLVAAAVGCPYAAFVGRAAHTCALVADDGSVWCWGYNSRGQLGDGTTWDRPRPVRVQGLPGASAVAAGLGFSCAATADGRLFCWGRNDAGQLGGLPGADQPTPVEVAGLSGVTAVAGGERAACAIHGVGQVVCWGRQWSGDYGGPTPISGLPSPAIKVVLDDQVACALLSSGAVWCWDPGTAPVAEGFAGALDVARIGFRTCVLEVDGTVPCAGLLPAPAVAIDGRGFEGCALLASGAVWCFGDEPLTEVSLGAAATGLSVGEWYACARLTDGAVSCWGDNWAGQLGDGTNRERPTPVSVAGLPGAAAAVAASFGPGVEASSCGLSESPYEAQ